MFGDFVGFRIILFISNLEILINFNLHLTCSILQYLAGPTELGGRGAIAPPYLDESGARISSCAENQLKK